MSSEHNAAGRSPVLHPDDSRAVISRYQSRIAQHGPTFPSLNSGSEEKQRLRHSVHASALITPQPAVLDIGCGLGGFLRHLQGSNVACAYTGYDIVPEYISECGRLYPQERFQQRNVFLEGIDGEFDTVVMSQVLNNRYEKSDNLEVMKTALEMAFRHSRASASVDMLSTYVDFRNPELFYYSPEDIFHFAKTIAPRVILRHDYRAHEFCIQLFHAAAPGYLP